MKQPILSSLAFIKHRALAVTVAALFAPLFVLSGLAAPIASADSATPATTQCGFWYHNAEYNDNDWMSGTSPYDMLFNGKSPTTFCRTPVAGNDGYYTYQQAGKTKCMDLNSNGLVDLASCSAIAAEWTPLTVNSAKATVMLYNAYNGTCLYDIGNGDYASWGTCNSSNGEDVFVQNLSS